MYRKATILARCIMLAKVEISSFIKALLHRTAQMDRALKRAYPQQHVVKKKKKV